MSTEIIVNNDIIEINVCEEPIIIEAPSGAYPLPSGVYSVYGRTGNVVAEDGDYNLTQLGDVTITNAATGQVLRYNGTSWVNSTESYVGTVTSVAATVPTGLTISGSPITTSGTLAIGLESGYSIPQTTNQTNWDTAYNRSLTSAEVTGTTTKTLTLNEQGGGTITASWTDINTDAVTSVFGRTGAVTAQSGDYNTLQVTENTNLYFTNQRARYAISGDSNSGVVYSNTTGIIALDDIPNTSLLHDSITINGYTTALGGSVSLTTSDVAEGTNLYFTNARAQAAISGTSPISVTSGVVSISQSGPSTNGYLSSADWNTFNGKQSALTLGNLTSSDITVTGGTGAVVGSGSTLTLATVNSNVGSYGDSTNVPTVTVNAKGLVTAVSQTAIPTASSTTTGLLTSSDWSAFDGKQAQLNGTGFVKVSGTTVSYDNSTYLTTISGIAAGGELSGTYANPSLVNSAVTGKVLTGVNITGGTIQATDSILTAFGKVQNQINGLIGGSIYKGTWNASTNNPALASGVGTQGWYYIVNVAGSTNLDGITDWNVGDWAIFDGTAWQQVDNTDAVVSVNGFTGAVSLTTSNISEGTNLYYTDARARGSISAGTGISYSSSTGVITNSAPDQTVSLTGAGTTSISGTYPSFTITSNDQYTGTVTSVGITESSAALSITGSPVTTSGDINIGFAGSSTEYVAGDGSLVTFPTIISQASNLVTEVYNETGETLTKGTIVYINGGHGNLPTVTKALANSDSTSAQTYGWINADLTNNNNGYVTIIGSLENMDTQAYAAGTQLYLSGTTAGDYTSTKPSAPIHLVYVGVVVRSHPTQGVIEVRIQNGYELNELHDVAITSPSNGNILQYNSSTSLWTNVAGTTTNIAEGTNLYFTDARARAAITLTTTGSSGASTYNSTTGALNVPTYTLAGLGGINLSSLSATSPLEYNNTTGVFSIQQSSGSQAGYLSSADWTTFNSKVSSQWTTSGSNIYYNTGNVGIGTSSPTDLLSIESSSTSGVSIQIRNIGTGANSYSSIKLGINGTFNANVGGIAALSTNFTTSGLYYPGGTYLYNNQSTGGISINSEAASPIYFGTNSVERMRISSTGNVSIGTTTANSILEIKASGATNSIRIGNIAVDATYNMISLNGTNAEGQYLGIAGGGGTDKSLYINSGNAGSLIFRTGNGTTFDERMRITSGGNVGIGTSTPNGKFNISNGGAEGIEFWPLSTTDSNMMQSYNRSTSAWNNLQYKALNHIFYGSGTERMRITSGGDVLFGKTTIDVDVKGVSIFNTVTYDGMLYSSIPYSANTLAVRDITNGAWRFYVGGNGTIYATNTSISAISDRRLKENIEDLDLGLDVIMALKPRKYDWKKESGNSGKGVRGFIAQEVEEILPDLIDEWKTNPNGENETTYKSLRQDFIPILVKAIQELKSEIDLLKAK